VPNAAPVDSRVRPALPAVQNTVYFNGSAITTPLLVLSALAVFGAMALALTAVFEPPALGPNRQHPEQPAPDTGAAAEAHT
jgi:hypothetical protein